MSVGVARNKDRLSLVSYVCAHLEKASLAVRTRRQNREREAVHVRACDRQEISGGEPINGEGFGQIVR